MSLAPNLRLFRGSHDLFGFDVYISQHDQHEAAYLFEFPAVPPWDELVTALATKTGREADGIVFSSKVYSDIVDDELSYQAWLAWSREVMGFAALICGSIEQHLRLMRGLWLVPSANRSS
ncbi:hypothetical protein JB92DRAFT_3128087 [Gautieria morchelliformis]|nr:hypothetical protein JB92DRAFT_3128087 [Gautieria morchelliformis]